MLEFLLSLFFIVCGIILGALAIGYLWGWLYRFETHQDETSYLMTADGWRLAVHRYRPKTAQVTYPVVLCHGLDSNRYIFDLTPGPSLARYLAQHGLDVWVAELRGAGMSDRPGLFVTDVPRSWSFDDHLKYDVPAVIAHVLARTGADKVHWIGHSMGGILIQAYLAAHPDAAVASVIAVGAPADFRRIRMKGVRLLAMIKPLLRAFPVPPMPFNGRLVLPIAHRLPSFLLGLFYPPNISPAVARQMVAVGSELITSTKLWLDFGRFVQTGELASEDGEPYLRHLDQCATPMLLFAGSKDLMAPPEAVKAAIGENAAGERRYHVFGKTEGTDEDYGHIDMIVGKRAHAEVYPAMVEWLMQKSGVHSQSSSAGEREAEHP
jgi:pimeloyl-ACP methyl ester carboxylesterase|uniref:Alpha/beta hydrolase n=1 Tax=Desulfomonile tiedjei TaxID=2358 RepID=A0A7C4EST2_9BACT